jgi:hypothetical protein
LIWQKNGKFKAIRDKFSKKYRKQMGSAFFWRWCFLFNQVPKGLQQVVFRNAKFSHDQLNKERVKLMDWMKQKASELMNESLDMISKAPERLRSVLKHGERVTNLAFIKFMSRLSGSPDEKFAER